MTKEDIRAQFGKELGGLITDEEWEVIVKKNYYEEIMMGITTIPDAARALREDSENYFVFAPRFFRRHLKPVSEKEQHVDKSKLDTSRISAHSKVLSIIFAYDASQEEDLQRFRESVLGNRLIEPSKVEAWIKKQTSVDGPPSFWLRDVPIPMDLWKSWMVSNEEKHTLKFTRNFIRLQKVELHYALEYAVPEDDWVRRISIAAEGVLEELRRLSEKFANRYGWQPALATVFVLTGYIPEVASIVSKIQSHFFKTHKIRLASKELRIPVIPKIHMTIDPSATPEEVSDYYGGMRRKILGNKRYRKLSDKHLNLALLKASVPKGESCTGQMSRWNKVHPEWRYRHSSNFVRDCLRSLHRLLMRDYIVPDELGKERPQWSTMSGTPR